MAGPTNIIKRKRIVKFLPAEAVNVICLQETHLYEQETGLLKETFRGNIYHALSTSRSLGVMIGISYNCSWILS